MQECECGYMLMLYIYIILIEPYNLSIASPRFCGITGPTSVTTNERGTSVKLRVYTGAIYDGFSCTAKAVRAEICMNATNPASKYRGGIEFSLFYLLIRYEYNICISHPV